MRDIEFRAWWKDTGKPVEDFMSNYTLEELNKDNHCIHVEQYTGLKDINGTKIFEGDIVTHDSLPGSMGNPVVFEGCSFIVKAKMPSDWVYLSKYSGLGMKVVGNIHNKGDKNNEMVQSNIKSV